MKRRLLVSMVVVTAFAVALFGVPFGVAVSRLYRGREVTKLEQTATRAARTLPPGGLTGVDRVELPPTPRDVTVAFYDSGGMRVAGVGPMHGGTEVTEALAGLVTNDHDGDYLAVAVPLQDEEAVIGAARASVRWSHVAHDTRRTWLLMTALGLGAIALAGALAAWLSTRLLVPVEGLAELAMRLGDGDFGARLPKSGVVEMDQAAVALNRTADRLGDLISRERAFTADVSHQINTPLTSLRLGLESALITPEANKTGAIEEALLEVDRLQATVATVLGLARDRDSGADAQCDVGAVCEEVAERLRGGLASNGRPLRVDISSEIPPARCPAEVLREVLTVLIDNASAHGRGAVSITARRAGAGLVIEVSDEGGGVTGDPERIFQRRAADSAGHGIGLSLARSLAEAHGGRLGLTQIGAHPVFTVALRGVDPPRP